MVNNIFGFSPAHLALFMLLFTPALFAEQEAQSLPSSNIEDEFESAFPEQFNEAFEEPLVNDAAVDKRQQVKSDDTPDSEINEITVDEGHTDKKIQDDELISADPTLDKVEHEYDSNATSDSLDNLENELVVPVEEFFVLPEKQGSAELESEDFVGGVSSGQQAFESDVAGSFSALSPALSKFESDESKFPIPQDPRAPEDIVDERVDMYGNRHGFWHISSNVGWVSRGYYMYSQRVGPWLSIRVNQTKEAQGEYVNNRRTGLWTFWNPRGKKEIEVEYAQGRYHGDYKKWNINNILIEQGQFVFDKKYGLWIDWHHNGNLKSYGYYNADYKTGLWKSWYANGEKKSQGHYHNGIQQGQWTYWHENGEMAQQGEYKNNIKNGEWTRWDENGDKLFAIKYE